MRKIFIKGLNRVEKSTQSTLFDREITTAEDFDVDVCIFIWSLGGVTRVRIWCKLLKEF